MIKSTLWLMTQELYQAFSRFKGHICGQENEAGDGLGTRLGLGCMSAVVLGGGHGTTLKEHTILPPPLLPLFCNTASDPILQVGVSWCFVSLRGGTLLQFLWFSHLTVFMAQSQDNCTYFGVKVIAVEPILNVKGWSLPYAPY